MYPGGCCGFQLYRRAVDAAGRGAAHRAGKIAPSAEHHDRTGEFPLDNIRLLGENGLMGIEVPTEYGGAGMDPVAYVLAMVEVAAADAAHSTIMSVNNSLFCNGILTHGTEQQKQTYVRAIAEGRPSARSR
jgi:alkylation response protein AidB-like acyl-CoA dehydrogenase